MAAILWFGLGGILGGYMASKATRNILGGVGRAGLQKLNELPEPCRSQVRQALLSTTTDDLSRGILREFGVKQDLIDAAEKTVMQRRAEGKMPPATPVFAELPVAASGQLYDPMNLGYGQYAPHTDYGAHHYFDHNATWNTYTAGSPPMHATGQYDPHTDYGAHQYFDRNATWNYYAGQADPSGYAPHTDYGAHNYLDPNATWNFYGAGQGDPSGYAPHTDYGAHNYLDPNATWNSYGAGHDYAPHMDYGPHNFMSHGAHAQWNDYATGALPPWFWPGAIGFVLGNVTRGWWQHSPHLLDISVMGQPSAAAGYAPHMDYGPHNFMSHGAQAQWNIYAGQAPPPPPPPVDQPAVPALPPSHPYNRYWNHMASRDPHWRAREHGWRNQRQWHPSWGAQPPAPPRV